MADTNEKITLTLKVDSSGTQKAAEDATQQVDKLKKSSKEASDGFGLMNTKLGGMFKGLKEGINVGVASLKTFSGALMATGIGVLLIAVSALVNYFKNTKEGGDQLARVMKVLGSVIREGPIVVLHALKIPLDIVVGYFKVLFSVISNTIGVITGKVGLTEAIKNVSEEFKKNVDKVKEDTSALIENGKQAVERAKQADIIAKMIDDANDQERETLLKKQKLETEIAQAKADAAEQDVSAIEKKALFNKALKLEGELYAINLAQSKARADIADAEIKNGDKSEEMLNQQAEAYKKLEATKTDYTQSTIKLNKQITSSDKAEAAEQLRILQEDNKKQEEIGKAQLEMHKELLKQRDEAIKLQLEKEKALREKYEKWMQALMDNAKEKMDTAMKEGAENRQAALDTEYENRLISDEEYIERKRQLDEINMKQMQQSTQKIALMNAKAAADQRKLMEDHKKASLNSMSDSLKAFSELAGKQSKIGKAMAIAAAVIDTYSSAIAAFRSMASIPVVGPILGAVAAAAAIALGLKNINEIRKAEPPKAQTGGIVQGNLHANGGVMVNMEGGEGIVNRQSMSNPLIAQDVMHLNNLGNAGGQSSYKGKTITEDRVAEIAAQVTKSIPVAVTEYQLSYHQQRVAVREGRFTV